MTFLIYISVIVRLLIVNIMRCSKIYFSFITQFLLFSHFLWLTWILNANTCCFWSVCSFFKQFFYVSQVIRPFGTIDEHAFFTYFWRARTHWNYFSVFLSSLQLLCRWFNTWRVAILIRCVWYLLLCWAYLRYIIHVSWRENIILYIIWLEVNMFQNFLRRLLLML